VRRWVVPPRETVAERAEVDFEARFQATERAHSAERLQLPRLLQRARHAPVRVSMLREAPGEQAAVLRTQTDDVHLIPRTDSAAPRVPSGARPATRSRNARTPGSSRPALWAYASGTHSGSGTARRPPRASPHPLPPPRQGRSTPRDHRR